MNNPGQPLLKPQVHNFVCFCEYGDQAKHQPQVPGESGKFLADHKPLFNKFCNYTGLF